MASAPIVTAVPQHDIIINTRYKIKNVSCEIENFVETHLCKLRGILRYVGSEPYLPGSWRRYAPKLYTPGSGSCWPQDLLGSAFLALRTPCVIGHPCIISREAGQSHETKTKKTGHAICCCAAPQRSRMHVICYLRPRPSR